MNDKIQVGQTWECKQDGRRVEVMRFGGTHIQVHCQKTSKITWISQLNFPKAYKWVRNAEGGPPPGFGEDPNFSAFMESERRVSESHPLLLAALKPFVDFLEAFEAKPISGLDKDEIYGIHGGCHVEGGTSIKWDHLRAARDAIRVAEGGKP